jgi:hypothetical protein
LLLSRARFLVRLRCKDTDKTVNMQIIAK